MDKTNFVNPILHVIVIGFHHKKGCQVEYSYPPLINENTDSNECPSGWKYLPTLALPDGSHNYTQDTVYFHLPSLKHPQRTVFGISCYRQISLEKVKNKTSDLTRSTVQKAVCVLSEIPLYGHIEVKMSLITQVYFEEGDFTKVSLLKDTYENLNSCLSENEDITCSPKFFVGLSAREFIIRFRHNALLLFKLLLLEKKVIFYCSPVHILCSTILSLLSLHPGMLENGLYQSACFRPSRPMSPVPHFHDEDVFDNVNDENEKQNIQQVSLEIKSPTVVGSNFNVAFSRKSITERNDLLGNNSVIDVNSLGSCGDVFKCEAHSPDETISNCDYNGDVTIQTNLSLISELNMAACGAPLQIFTEGYLCLPYLSLPYMDVLLDPNVRGYLIGATNVLFKQKKNIVDVLIEVDPVKIETHDVELKRCLSFSKEDRRFADNIVKHVCEEKPNIGDGIMWEGGDEWIRMQFKMYLFSLLRTSLLPEGSRELDFFNNDFISAWKDTNNYKAWVCDYSQEIQELNSCHPFAGQLCVADMKLMLSQTLQFSDGGKKINQVVGNTSKAVATTGRAMSGAIKGAVSSFFTNFSNNNKNLMSDDSIDDVH